MEFNSTPTNLQIAGSYHAIYESLYNMADPNATNCINGMDAANFLSKSGLTRVTLGKIWDLCDPKGNGFLDKTGIFKALKLIALVQNGKQPSIADICANVPPPKLIINDELMELQIEKSKLEAEVNQEEAALKLKESDIKNLQNEIETLQMMIRQLEIQKTEAAKRLDELANQCNELAKTFHNLQQIIAHEELKVDQFNQQLEEQKLKVGQQEGELVAKRKELEELKGEESQLEAKLEACKKETEFTAKNVGDTQLEISHIKTKLMELEEYDRRLNDGITELDVSISSKDIMKINNLLPRTITPPLIEAEQQNNGFSSNEFPSDPFAGEDPFKGSDPFQSEGTFAVDPFANSQSEPFDPFGTGAFYTQKSDSFGADPFAAIKPPELPRSESPTPALPPKKSKAPPPRPAPPKHGNKAPLRAAPAPPLPQAGEDPFKSDQFASSNQFDPFSNSGVTNFSSSSNFANFANFDKIEIPPPVDPYATLASIHKDYFHKSSSQSSQNGQNIYSKGYSQQFSWAFQDESQAKTQSNNSQQNNSNNFSSFTKQNNFNGNFQF